MCLVCADHDPDRALLVDAINGDRGAFEQIVGRYHPRLLGLARYAAPDLAVLDLFEDAVNETWIVLMRARPGSYDPARSSVLTFLGLLLRQGARRVRADHAQPGRRTRERRTPDGDGAPAVIRLPPANLDRPCTSAETEFAAVEEAMYADSLLHAADSSAPPWVARALRGIHDYGITISAAAGAEHRHGSSLRRALVGWVLTAEIERSA